MTRESGEVHASHWRRLGACAPLLGRRRSVAAAARLCKQGRLTAWQAKGPPTQHDDVRRGVSIAEHNREQEGCPLSNHKHSSEPPPPPMSSCKPRRVCETRLYSNLKHAPGFTQGTPDACTQNTRAARTMVGVYIRIFLHTSNASRVCVLHAVAARACKHTRRRAVTQRA